MVQKMREVKLPAIDPVDKNRKRLHKSKYKEYKHCDKCNRIYVLKKSYKERFIENMSDKDFEFCVLTSCIALLMALFLGTIFLGLVRLLA